MELFPETILDRWKKFRLLLCYAVFSEGANVRKEKRWNKNDTFPWGKHKGETLISVMVHDVRYITWCIENVAGFVLDNEFYETYEAFADTPYLNSHLRRD